MNHWLILPILLPAIVAPLLALALRHDLTMTRTFSVGSTVLLVLLGGYLTAMASDGVTRTYALGEWGGPVGIVLVLDRLAAVMLLLTATLGLGIAIYSLSGCDKAGPHFHPLLQFQLMGLNGAFLTGDLFNLFVFFEILLIASYGLMVHGGGAARVRAGLQYVMINLVGSSIFLIGLGLIYGVTGTLNMADFAAKATQIAAADSALLQTGLALLVAVFGIKAAVVPLHFWLPGTYANAAGPVAALFAIMTKVGAYALIRVFTLCHGDAAGGAADWFASGWLVWGGVATLIVGTIGIVGARSLNQQASFAGLASMGTLLIAIGGFTPALGSAAIYYLIHSTLAVAALFLVIDMIIRRRTGFGDALVAAPRFVHGGLIAATFFVIAIAVIGLPPLSGFIGKLLILSAIAGQAPGAEGGGGVAGWPWLWGVILVTSLLALIGFAFSGTLVFWRRSSDEPAETAAPPIVVPMVAVGWLLACMVLMTLLAGPATDYFDQTAGQLFRPQGYLEATLGEAGGGGGS
jgi:multicomponent K+:H+ antiporter subunit D